MKIKKTMAVGEEEEEDRRPRSRPSLKTRVSFNNYQSWKDKVFSCVFVDGSFDFDRLLVKNTCDCNLFS